MAGVASTGVARASSRSAKVRGYQHASQETTPCRTRTTTTTPSSIGAGIIGAATAFELAKLGYRTLSVDKLPAAGYGPTSASCAIIRVHYSTFDGIALAWEG